MRKFTRKDTLEGIFKINSLKAHAAPAGAADSTKYYFFTL